MTTVLTKPCLRLAAARDVAGFRTAKEFSETYGIEPSVYSSHESGRRGIRESVAQKYAEILSAKVPGVTADWIRFGEGDCPVEALAVRTVSGKNITIFGGREADHGALTGDDDGDFNLANMPGPDIIRRDLLATILYLTETMLAREGLHVPAAQKVELILALYELHLDDAAKEGEPAGAISIDRYRHVIRLAAKPN